MDKLIPVINKLQDVFNTAGTSIVQLPQIVVIGEQSSGKSSVLESLVGRSCLPRGINIVTRCPIVLQMIQANGEDEVYLQKSEELKAQEWVEFPHLPPGETIVTDFDRLTDIIDKEVERRSGSKKGIVKEELVLRIVSPNVINLTVVDLPGIVRNPVDGQPVDIEKQILELLTSYITNPNSIILAVSAANNDIATSESIKMAKSVDPGCDRTIAVITKLDLMDKGTDATEVLTGKVMKLKLGIIGVVNRSYEDMNNKVSIAESINNEARYLTTNYPQIAMRHGTSFLKTRLQTLLMDHIKKCLPPLQSRLTNMKIQAENELKELGTDQPDNKGSAMLHVLEKFCNNYKAAIVGKNRNVEKRVLTGGAQINLAFEDKLAYDLKFIDPNNDLQNVEILNTIANSGGIESSIIIPEAAYQGLAREQIRRLEVPALQCATLVNTEMINIMQIIMTILERDMRRFPNLTTAISMEVTEVLRERHLIAQEMLKSYVEVHSSFIKTMQMDFNEKMLDLLRQNPVSKQQLHPTTNETVDDRGGHSILVAVMGDDLTENQKTQCLVVRQLVNAYFQIVKSAFLDYCPKAIAHAVIYYVESNIYRHLIEKLHTKDKIDSLVQESAIIAEQRKHILSTLQALENAIEIIGEIRELQFQ